MIRLAKDKAASGAPLRNDGVAGHSIGYEDRVRGAAKRNYAVANNPASPRLRRGRHAIHPRGNLPAMLCIALQAGLRGILAKANKILMQ